MQTLVKGVVTNLTDLFNGDDTAYSLPEFIFKKLHILYLMNQKDPTSPRHF